MSSMAIGNRRLASSGLRCNTTQPDDEPVIASSNRYNDIAPYCGIIYAAEPHKWGDVLPWEFPQNASRRNEEAFLRQFFDDREIRIQGGADGDGNGYRFLKQVWYTIAIWNLEQRIPAIANWWLEQPLSQELLADPNWLRWGLHPDVKPETFFPDAVHLCSKKLLRFVVQHIQAHVASLHSQPTVPTTSEVLPSPSQKHPLPQIAESPSPTDTVLPYKHTSQHDEQPRKPVKVESSAHDTATESEHAVVRDKQVDDDPSQIRPTSKGSQHAFEPRHRASHGSRDLSTGVRAWSDKRFDSNGNQRQTMPPNRGRVTSTASDHHIQGYNDSQYEHVQTTQQRYSSQYKHNNGQRWPSDGFKNGGKYNRSDHGSNSQETVPNNPPWPLDVSAANAYFVPHNQLANPSDPAQAQSANAPSTTWPNSDQLHHVNSRTGKPFAGVPRHFQQQQWQPPRRGSQVPFEDRVTATFIGRNRREVDCLFVFSVRNDTTDEQVVEAFRQHDTPALSAFTVRTTSFETRVVAVKFRNRSAADAGLRLSNRLLPAYKTRIEVAGEFWDDTNCYYQQRYFGFSHPVAIEGQYRPSYFDTQARYDGTWTPATNPWAHSDFALSPPAQGFSKEQYPQPYTPVRHNNAQPPQESEYGDATVSTTGNRQGGMRNESAMPSMPQSKKKKKSQNKSHRRYSGGSKDDNTTKTKDKSTVSPPKASKSKPASLGGDQQGSWSSMRGRPKHHLSDRHDDGFRNKAGHDHHVPKDDLKTSPALQDVAKKDIAKEKIAKENIAKKDVGKRDVTKKVVIKKDVAKDDVAEKDVAEKDVTNKDIVEKDITEKDVANSISDEMIVEAQPSDTDDQMPVGSDAVWQEPANDIDVQATAQVPHLKHDAEAAKSTQDQEAPQITTPAITDEHNDADTDADIKSAHGQLEISSHAAVKNAPPPRSETPEPFEKCDGLKEIGPAELSGVLDAKSVEEPSGAEIGGTTPTQHEASKEKTEADISTPAKHETIKGSSDLTADTSPIIPTPTSVYTTAPPTPSDVTTIVIDKKSRVRSKSRKKKPEEQRGPEVTESFSMFGRKQDKNRKKENRSASVRKDAVAPKQVEPKVIQQPVDKVVKPNSKKSAKKEKRKVKQGTARAADDRADDPSTLTDAAQHLLQAASREASPSRPKSSALSHIIGFFTSAHSASADQQQAKAVSEASTTLDGEVKDSPRRTVVDDSVVPSPEPAPKKDSCMPSATISFQEADDDKDDDEVNKTEGIGLGIVEDTNASVRIGKKRKKNKKKKKPQEGLSTEEQVRELELSGIAVQVHKLEPYVETESESDGSSRTVSRSSTPSTRTPRTRKMDVAREQNHLIVAGRPRNAAKRRVTNRSDDIADRAIRLVISSHDGSGEAAFETTDANTALQRFVTGMLEDSSQDSEGIPTPSQDSTASKEDGSPLWQIPEDATKGSGVYRFVSGSSERFDMFANDDVKGSPMEDAEKDEQTSSADTAETIQTVPPFDVAEDDGLSTQGAEKSD